MELYKDKEEADAISRDNDLTQGIKLDINPDEIDFSKFEESSPKALTHKEIKKGESSNTLDDLHSFKHPMEDAQDINALYAGIPLDDIPEEVAEAILSIEDILEHFDKGEDTIDD